MRKTLNIYLFFVISLLSSCIAKGDEQLIKFKELQAKEKWQIVFTWRGDSLYYFSFNKNDRKIFYNKEYFISYPSFSRDGERIVFCMEKIGGQKDVIVIMNSDGSGFRKLLSFKNASGTSLSPDGKKIAFWGDYNNAKKSTDLYLFDIEENKIKFLQKEATYSETAFAPSWSSDSKQLVYASLDGYITIIDIENLSIEKLVKGDAPSWSPDGKTIIYREGISYFRILPDKKTTEYYIEGHKYYSINPRGENKKFVFDGKPHMWEFAGNTFAPVVWSPDSKFILFYRPYDSFIEGPNLAKIYIMEIEKNKIFFIKKLSVSDFSWSSSK
jgi:Tol biopolymer transport system component